MLVNDRKSTSRSAMESAGLEKSTPLLVLSMNHDVEDKGKNIQNLLKLVEEASELPPIPDKYLTYDPEDVAFVGW